MLLNLRHEYWRVRTLIKKMLLGITLSLMGLLIGCSNRLDKEFRDAMSWLNDVIPNKVYHDTTLYYSAENGVQISYLSDDVDIFDGRLIYAFPDVDTKATLNIQLSFNNKTHQFDRIITLVSKDDLPKSSEIHIEVGSRISSREDYVEGTLDVIDFDDNNNPTYLLDDVSMKIRLRGNSTHEMPKKSFKIKFNSKQFMFSDYKEKDWVLLANHADQSLIRNALAFQMASELGMDFVPMVKFVNLYINDEYHGNYMLTDQVEVTNDRVDIEENNPVMDTGYLLEFDKKLYASDFVTDENFFIIDGIPFVIKSPEKGDESYIDEQYYYIEDYMRKVFDVIKAHGDYHAYIDEASFIDWYIINELFKNVDSGYSSVFYYKDAQGLLKMGPVWDFDLSIGNYGHLEVEARGPEGFYTSRQDKNVLFYYLMQSPTFRVALKTRWQAVYDEVILGLLDDIYPTADSITRSRYENFLKWEVIGIENKWYTTPEILERDTYQKQVEFLKAFLTARIDWMNTEISQY